MKKALFVALLAVLLATLVLTSVAEAWSPPCPSGWKYRQISGLYDAYVCYDPAVWEGISQPVYNGWLEEKVDWVAWKITYNRLTRRWGTEAHNCSMGVKFVGLAGVEFGDPWCNRRWLPSSMNGGS